MLDSPSPLLRAARETIRTLTAAGYEAYMVGGFVRDYMLNRPVHDIDIATSALPADVMRLFARTVPTGIQHGTVTVICGAHSFEVTTFRREGFYEDHRRPASVDFVDSLTEDLSRRDFTINAMAMDAEGRVIDPFGGRNDLRAGVLRAVGDPGERFAEDALRMLRCIRFAAGYGLTIDAAAWAAIGEHRALLRHIAMERVRLELAKTIEGSDPDRGVSLLIESRLLTCTKVSLDWRPFTYKPTAEYDMQGLRELPGTARWACLFLSAEHLPDEADAIMRTLTFSNEARTSIVKILSLFVWVKHAACAPDAVTPAALQRLWTDGAITYGKQTAVHLLQVLRVIGDASWPKMLLLHAERWLNEIRLWGTGELAISGRDLTGLASGPGIGRLLHLLVIDTALGEVANDRETLLERAVYVVKAWEGDT